MFLLIRICLGPRRARFIVTHFINERLCTFIVDRITHLMTDSADSVRKIARDTRFIDSLKIVYNFSKPFLKQLHSWHYIVL